MKGFIEIRCLFHFISEEAEKFKSLIIQSYLNIYSAEGRREFQSIIVLAKKDFSLYSSVFVLLVFTTMYGLFLTNEQVGCPGLAEGESSLVLRHSHYSIIGKKTWQSYTIGNVWQIYEYFR